MLQEQSGRIAWPARTAFSALPPALVTWRSWVRSDWSARRRTTPARICSRWYMTLERQCDVAGIITTSCYCRGLQAEDSISTPVAPSTQEIGTSLHATSDPHIRQAQGPPRQNRALPDGMNITPLIRSARRLMVARPCVHLAHRIASMQPHAPSTRNDGGVRSLGVPF